MKRLILAAAALALAVPLAACGGDAPPVTAGQTAPPAAKPAPIARASAELARVERAYALAQAVADLFLPRTDPRRVAVETRIETALAAARAAVTVAEQVAALARAEAAIADLAPS